METKGPLVIYHGNCADGFTAAWVAWLKLDDAEFHAGVYQDPPPDVAGRDVVLVDFSYKRDVLAAMARRARSVLVLDHHRTAEADLRHDTDPASEFWVHRIDGWEPAARCWDGHKRATAQDIIEGCPPTVYALFDMERSGAGIAADYFFPDSARPPLVSYVEDRDLWKFALPSSREINAWVFSFAYDFRAWSAMADELERDFAGAAAQGAAIERKHHKDVAELVAALRTEMVIGGQWVPACNLPYTLTSDAGHLMCEPYPSPNLQGEVVTPPFAACWWDTAEGRVFSLRSRPDGADVSEVAKRYGGGGHRSAAGFRLPHGAKL